MRVVIRSSIDAFFGLASGAVLVWISMGLTALLLSVFVPSIRNGLWTIPLGLVAAVPALVVESYCLRKYWSQWRWFWLAALLVSLIGPVGIGMTPGFR